MIKILRLALIITVLALVGNSCVPKPLYWAEYADGTFYTRDIVRAQQEMTFTIIVPDYMPEIKGVKLPSITGNLKESSSDGKAKIMLLYPLKYSDNSVITIIECNYVYTSLDPKLNPWLEVVNMQGKQVIRCINNEYSDFCFNEDGIYYVLFCRDVPATEAEKVVESILKQL